MGSGTGNDEVLAMALDSTATYLYVVGYYSSTLSFTVGSTTYSSFTTTSSNADALVVKISA